MVILFTSKIYIYIIDLIKNVKLTFVNTYESL